MSAESAGIYDMGDTETSAEDTSAEDTSAEETSVAEASAEETSAEDTSAEETSTEGQGDDAPQEIELTLPEGVQYSEEMLESYKAFVKENGLSSELASKGLSWMHQQTELQRKAEEAVVSQMQKEWKDSVAKDKEFGGKNFQESQRHVYSAIHRFGGDPADADGRNEFQTALSELKISNHPAIYKLLARVGRALAEDKPGGSPAGGDRPLTRDEKLAAYYEPDKR